MAKKNIITGGLPPDKVKAMEALMTEHEGGLLRYATRILNDPDAAQDVVQNTFIKLYRHWEAGRAQTGNVSSWLYRVTHNNAVDYIRHENRIRILHHKNMEDTKIRNNETDCGKMTNRERMELALKHMCILKPQEQQVLLLRLQDGKSYREIAEITERSEGNIGCILHDAVSKLSASLKKAGVTEL
jgi:RNA polymerase sigma-70 factor (ECF subfamily)